MIGTYIKMLSLRPLSELELMLSEHDAAPHLGAAQRDLADEMTTLVHGAAEATAARVAADLLFGSDPTTAPESALAMLVDEVPSSRMSAGSLGDTVGVVVAAGLVSSNSEARRALSQRSIRANGVVVEAGDSLGDVDLLHGRFLLLRKGKKTHHLVEVFS
jgi:tyrosyl-tRNA synthetase